VAVAGLGLQDPRSFLSVTAGKGECQLTDRLSASPFPAEGLALAGWVGGRRHLQAAATMLTQPCSDPTRGCLWVWHYCLSLRRLPPSSFAFLSFIPSVLKIRSVHRPYVPAINPQRLFCCAGDLVPSACFSPPLVRFLLVFFFGRSDRRAPRCATQSTVGFPSTWPLALHRSAYVFPVSSGRKAQFSC